MLFLRRWLVDHILKHDRAYALDLSKPLDSAN
jgi:hemerythrin